MLPTGGIETIDSSISSFAAAMVKAVKQLHSMVCNYRQLYIGAKVRHRDALWIGRIQPTAYIQETGAPGER